MQNLKSKNTLKALQPLRAGGVFIVGYAGPNPGQFGYQEEAEFAVAYNAYYSYLARGWDVAMSYLETPQSDSAILVYQSKSSDPLDVQEVTV